MRNEKGNFSSPEEKIFNVAKSYLKRGLFDKAKEKFIEVQEYEELAKLAKFAIKLCAYEVKDVSIEESKEFYDSIKNIAIENLDLDLFQEAYKAWVEVSNEYFNLQDYTEEVLSNFNLTNHMSFEELKVYIEGFKETYLYVDMLTTIAEEYLEVRKFEESLYFVELLREISPKDHRPMFLYILCKAKAVNEDELIDSNIKLSQLPEFDELLLLCDEDYERDHFVSMIEAQEQVLVNLATDTISKLVVYIKNNEQWLKPDTKRKLTTLKEEMEVAKETNDEKINILLEDFFRITKNADIEVKNAIEAKKKSDAVRNFFESIGDFLKFAIVTLIVLGGAAASYLFLDVVTGLLATIGAAIVGNIIFKIFDSTRSNKTLLSICHLLTTLVVGLYMYLTCSDPVWGFEDGYAAWGFWNYMGEGTYGWLFMIAPFAYIFAMSIFNTIAELITWKDFEESVHALFETFLTGALILALLNLLPLLVEEIGLEPAMEIGVIVRGVSFVIVAALVTCPEETSTVEYLSELFL